MDSWLARCYEVAPSYCTEATPVNGYRLTTGVKVLPSEPETKPRTNHGDKMNIEVFQRYATPAILAALANGASCDEVIEVARKPYTAETKPTRDGYTLHEYCGPEVGWEVVTAGTDREVWASALRQMRSLDVRPLQITDDKSIVWARGCETEYNMAYARAAGW